jgi:hypothetical protein
MEHLLQGFNGVDAPDVLENNELEANARAHTHSDDDMQFQQMQIMVAGKNR